MAENFEFLRNFENWQTFGKVINEKCRWSFLTRCLCVFICVCISDCLIVYYLCLLLFLVEYRTKHYIYTRFSITKNTSSHI